MCVGRCDCLVVSGRVAVTVANHSISVFFSYHYCPSHRNTNVYSIGKYPTRNKPHPLYVGYVTSLVICLWLIIRCTRLGAHKPNWVSCSFCHILLMMISVLFFFKILSVFVSFFQQLNLPDSIPRVFTRSIFSQILTSDTPQLAHEGKVCCDISVITVPIIVSCKLDCVMVALDYMYMQVVCWIHI